MTQVLVSSDGPNGERLRSWKTRHYHRLQRTTPSGRIYDILTATLYSGAVWHNVTEITRDGSRALRTILAIEHPGRGSIAA